MNTVSYIIFHSHKCSRRLSGPSNKNTVSLFQEIRRKSCNTKVHLFCLKNPPRLSTVLTCTRIREMYEHRRVTMYTKTASTQLISPHLYQPTVRQSCIRVLEATSPAAECNVFSWISLDVYQFITHSCIKTITGSR